MSVLLPQLKVQERQLLSGGIRLDSGKLASCKSVAGVPEMLQCTAVLMPAKLPCNRPALPLMSSTAVGIFFCGVKLDPVHQEQAQGELAAEPLP